MGAFQNGREGGNGAYGKITGAYRNLAGNQHCGEKPRCQADAEDDFDAVEVDDEEDFLG